MDAKNICIALVHCETEKGVIKVLDQHGLWDNSSVWKNYGENENNFSVIGNQASRPEAALVEKLINSVDAVLMAECLSKGINPESPQAPNSIRKAVKKFFGIRDGKLSNILPTERGLLAEKIC